MPYSGDYEIVAIDGQRRFGKWLVVVLQGR